MTSPADTDHPTKADTVSFLSCIIYLHFLNFLNFFSSMMCRGEVVELQALMLQMGDGES